MHTLASPSELTYKLGKHNAATEADVLQSKNFYTEKSNHTLLQVW
jgi:hypothetical protein